jgi:protein gp37
MADNTKIEWADATWNPVTGCSLVSPGCTNCYAMRLAGGRLQHHPSRAGLTQPSKSGPVWTGEVRFNDDWLTQPIRWRRPRRIFVCAHGDLFAESVPDEWIDCVFAVIALAPKHTFLLLTKRPERIGRYLADDRVYKIVLRAADQLRQWRPELRAIPISHPCGGVWWPQLWLGASIEDQRRADERREHLQALSMTGWRTFVSYEPALGSVDWQGWEFLHWLVSGGESGRGARPSHPDWHRAARDFCRAHGIPYCLKSWGDWLPVCAPSDEGHDALYRSNRVARDGEDQERLDEAFGRTCLVPRLCLSADANHLPADSPDARRAGTAPMLMFQTKKKRAGRLLDGRAHDGLPTPQRQQLEFPFVGQNAEGLAA